MGAPVAETSIAWTDYTFNPWWGCVRVSPGCEHCYAETFSHRLGLDLWGPAAGRRFFDDKHWRQPMAWAERVRKGDKRHRVFCASMADVFETNDVLQDQRTRLWNLIEATPRLTWQLLTKRPENIRSLVPRAWLGNGFPANVWLLTTAEDQARFDARWPYMEGLDAVAKGVSYEPALGPINFGSALKAPRGIDWVIFGGESGRGARACELAWARTTRDACQAAGVAFFYKQGGAANHCEHDSKDSKGDHFECFPEDLKLREFPA